jgi:DNA gyrase/topoisomerase IV subunit A
VALNPPFQVRINCIHIALVGNRPLTLPLTDILKTFVDFRVNVIRRRSQFHLAKAETRQHIVQGLLKALASMDAIVELIRRATNAGAAAKGKDDDLVNVVRGFESRWGSGMQYCFWFLTLRMLTEPCKYPQ